MTREMWSPSRTRTWGERHPILFELIGMVLSLLGIALAALLAVWKM
jgi:hypothetical protein